MGKKILFITIVPPFPDDQGNRVVTRNYMDYFISRGYNIDVVLQAGYDAKRAKEYYGDKVTFYRTFGNAGEKDEAMYRIKENEKERIAELLDQEKDIYKKSILEEMFCAANHYHPFSMISDETVDRTEKCIQENIYDYIVCNYIYSLRPIVELRNKYEMPKVITITIDAVSRLDQQALYYGINTGNRACSKLMEAECLNQSDVVCAISRFEKKYFEEIGVEKKCILVEYDGYEQAGKIEFGKRNHDNLQVCFFASGNPLNEKGILHFLDKSWPRVIEKHPESKLIIMGNICGKIENNYTNVELLGRVDETELFQNMRNSFLAINPTYLGTGLKIKSVDMICAGLPFVTFQCGVEGHEDLDGKAFLIADDWDDFADKINILMDDFSLWENLCDGARQAGAEYFSKESVYKELELVTNNGIEF